jgi:L-threonylcarbamoyladenylate synthase
MIDNQHIKRAVDLLKQGRLVAFPTETVYGLGADAANPEAVRRVFAAKERPANHPLIVHIADTSELETWAQDISPAARALAKIFWPGPLTLLFTRQPHVSDQLTGGQSTIGIRMPRHPVAQQLLRAFGSGIAAPSANKFTHVSPTDAEAVRHELGDKVDLILDGGPCEVGLESTIIDMSSRTPAILRPGMIGRSAIEAVLQTTLAASSNARAPGMHVLHYAPRTKTLLLNSEAISSQMQTDKHVVLTLRDLGITPDEYAHNLYRALRDVDNQNFTQIIIEDVPRTPEWEAIRDRLIKACARTA